MKKAKPATHHAESVKCPVLPIAVRLGQIWDAFAMADELKRDDAAECINKLRIFAEEAVSFERARSMAGALVQVALALDAATALHEKVPGGDKAADLIFERLVRLLDSAALVLYDACPAGEYDMIRNTMNVYNSMDGSTIDRPLKWLEDVPELATAYRSAKAT
jgi:hypothetical protein